MILTKSLEDVCYYPHYREETEVQRRDVLKAAAEITPELELEPELELQ